MLKYRGHVIGDTVCTCGQVHDARRLRTDPTGTASIRRAFAADVDIRWRGVRRMVRTVLVAQDLLGRNGGGVGADTAMRVQSFESWLDSMVRTTVVDAGMVRGYVDRASALGVRTAAALVGSGGQTRGRVDLITGLAVSELRTVGSQVTQQATRVVSDGLLKNKTTARILLDVLQVIDKVGIPRSRLTTDHVVVRAYNDATLDVFEQAGHGMVDVMPELRPATRVGDAKKTKKTKKSRKTGPGSRVSRARTPSARTIGRIAKLEAETEAWAKRVNVETAEDDKVCTICLDIAEEGPYSINTARSLIPAHPRCRCAFVPVRRRVKDEFREADHPRHPKGTRPGGQFAESGASNSDITSGARRLSEKELQKLEPNWTRLPDPKTAETSREAVKAWMTGGYEEINAALRTGDEDDWISSPERRNIRGLSRLFEYYGVGHKLDTDITVYRGASGNHEFADVKPGDIVSDRGFNSTSTSKYWAKQFVGDDKTRKLLHITVPKGTTVVSPLVTTGKGDLTQYESNENELLLNRGTRYRIKKVRGRIIFAEVVQ